MSEIVRRRLTNAMRGLRQECEASGDALPDCEFVVRVVGGKVEINPTPRDASPPRIQGGEGNAADEAAENLPAVKRRKRT